MSNIRWLGNISVYQDKKTGEIFLTCNHCENNYDTPLDASMCCREEKVKLGWGNLLGADK